MKLFILFFICSYSIFFYNNANALELSMDEKSAIEKSKIEDKFWFAGDYTLKVVQNRYFKKDKRVEFTLLNAGYFLKNQYIDITSIGGGISYYFSEIWGWEIISGSITFTKERAEVQALKEAHNVTADIRKPEYIFTSNLLWIPMYGKYSLLESRFIYYDTYFLIGPGIVNLNKKIKPAINIGVGQKYYISQSWLTRVDLKAFYYEDTIYGKTGIRDKIVLSVGMSYVF
jgi:outer membrane beta-barrel protein